MYNFTLTTTLFLLSLLSLANSQTTISGDINDLIFDAAGNPHIIESDIIVPSGTKCTITAGCVFLFKPFTGLTVVGTLIVAGTSEKPVIFTSINNSDFNPESREPPKPFDWNGITVAAESNGTAFSNIQISYSVYGIKSLTPNLTANQCTFSQNGQYHFTVKDKIIKVIGSIPFSYPEPATLNDEYAKTTPQDTAIQKPSQQPSMQKKLPFVKKYASVIRFGSLGIGAAGIISGMVLTKFAFDEKDRIEAMGPLAINPATGNFYERTDSVVVEAHTTFTRLKTGSVAAFILGGLGLTGFTVTFLF